MTAKKRLLGLLTLVFVGCNAVSPAHSQGPDFNTEYISLSFSGRPCEKGVLSYGQYFRTKVEAERFAKGVRDATIEESKFRYAPEKPGGFVMVWYVGYPTSRGPR